MKPCKRCGVRGRVQSCAWCRPCKSARQRELRRSRGVMPGVAPMPMAPLALRRQLYQLAVELEIARR